MTTHRFSVNVPNPTAKATSVLLSLKPEKKADLKHLRLASHQSTLEVVNAYLATDLCATKGEPELKVKLKPYTSVDVYVIIQTAPSKKPASVFYNLIDQRGTKVVGGVLIACQEPNIPDSPGSLINTKNPCPVKLATDIYIAAVNGDPRKPIPKNKITFGTSVEIVAPITNPTSKPLKDVVVYLEHLGISGIEFEPGAWNVGTLDSKNVFYATWVTRFNPGQNSIFHASIVVASQGKDPVRLNGSFEFSGKKDW